MKTQPRWPTLAGFGLLAAAGLTLYAAPFFLPVTYQGRLADADLPANGSYELQVGLFHAASGGSPVQLLTNNIVVSNGLFTTVLQLDGTELQNLTTDWLELGVRTNGSAAAFTLLRPRQELTYAPRAARADVAELAIDFPEGAVSSYHIAQETIQAGDISAGEVVKSVNGLKDAVTLAASGGISITPAGNTLTISNSGWNLNGNAGTTAGPHFLGTTDNQPLELKVRSERALRLEPTPVDSSHSNIVNVVAGSVVNEVAPGIYGGTISGGGALYYIFDGVTNRVTGNFGTVAGGYGNTAGSFSTIGGGAINTTENPLISATIGGGVGNRIAQASYSVVGGGYINQIGSNSPCSSIVGGEIGNIGENADHSFIGGGSGCNIGNNAQFAVIGGGWANAIGVNADFATIPGGVDNRVSGSYGFAAGRHAGADHDGTFVWADSINASFSSTSSNQFLIRASGGVGINTANPVADLHVNGPIVIQSTAVTPGATSSSNLLNIMVAGGSSPLATNGSANGISFYEGPTNKSMSLGYDGSGNAAANALRIYGAVDSPLYTFQNDGRMGVGTPTPATALHLKDAAGDTEISVESSDPGGHRWTMQSSSVSGSANLDASFQIIDRTAGGSRFFIGTNGFVGIGTTSPTNRLHVNGGISATAFVTTSDRNAKENFRAVSPAEVLSKVAALPITKWNFKELKDGQHLGPMAQDFYAAFGLGGGETTITTVDADGVALAAIQGLNQKVEAGSQRSEVRSQQLETRSRKLEERLQQKETEITELKQTVNELKELVQAMNHKLTGGAK